MGTVSDYVPRHKYQDIVRCWRGDLLDHHVTYHTGRFEQCEEHRCHGFRWKLQQHGEQPDFDITRQR